MEEKSESLTNPEIIKFMEENGYLLISHAEHHLSFKKGTSHIWQIKDGWQVADLIDGAYQGHRPQPTIQEAIENV